MWSKKIALFSLIIGAALAGGTSYATDGTQFANGQSLYGQPADPSAPARVIKVASARYVNAAYGETIRFVSAGRSFSWQFNGLDRRGVELGRIAPPGFSASALVVYVGRNPLDRGPGR